MTVEKEKERHPSATHWPAQKLQGDLRARRTSWPRRRPPHSRSPRATTTSRCSRSCKEIYEQGDLRALPARLLAPPLASSQQVTRCHRKLQGYLQARKLCAPPGPAMPLASSHQVICRHRRLQALQKLQGDLRAIGPQGPPGAPPALQQVTRRHRRLQAPPPPPGAPETEGRSTSKGTSGPSRRASWPRRWPPRSR